MIEHKIDAFSNRPEYQLFLEKNCYRCRHYVPPEEATPDNPECRTEAAIAEAVWDPGRWPEGKIKMFQDRKTGEIYIPHCVDFDQEG